MHDRGIGCTVNVARGTKPEAENEQPLPWPMAPQTSPVKIRRKHGRRGLVMTRSAATRAAKNGGYSQNGSNLGDSPIVRALRGNFSSQRSLPHLAKHFSLGFLFVLRAKKPHTNENLSGSTPPSRHNGDYCFHMAKISDKGLKA